MQLAYTMTDTKGDLDSVLLGLSERLMEKGWRTAGVVQTNTDREDCHRCDMDVRVLPDGPIIRISQSLGKEARGCRLDPNALEHAVAAVGQTLTGPADVLIVNKFGKHEANGRGFRDLIANAMSRGIPVIAGVNELNKQAFLEFSGNMAVQLPASVQSLEVWLEKTRSADGEDA